MFYLIGLECDADDIALLNVLLGSSGCSDNRVDRYDVMNRVFVVCTVGKIVRREV